MGERERERDESSKVLAKEPERFTCQRQGALGPEGEHVAHKLTGTVLVASEGVDVKVPNQVASVAAQCVLPALANECTKSLRKMPNVVFASDCATPCPRKMLNIVLVMIAHNPAAKRQALFSYLTAQSSQAQHQTLNQVVK